MTEGATLQNLFLVRSEHLNHHGNLFGGDMMSQIDTTAYCLVRQVYGKHTFVTRAAQFEFVAAARLGDVICFSARIDRVGTTSVTVSVTGTVGDTEICSATMVYVNLGADGRKAAVG